MVSSATVSCFIGFWAALYLVDTSLRYNVYTRQRYSEFIGKRGISIKFLRASVFTQRFNRIMQSIGQLNCLPWSFWFTIGTFFTVILMLFSIFVLSSLIYNTFNNHQVGKQIITTVVPGVNLPMSHLWIYMLTLLICAVLHEAGHALAALTEKVRVHGFGLFLLGIYPGAYVDLNTADLNTLSPLKRLKIFSAGVWHNFVIVILALSVFYGLPYFLAPAYAMGQGVGVTFLERNSVITGPRGLHLGDAITQVNSCKVTNQADWFRCLQEAYSHPTGYCVSGSYLNAFQQPDASQNLMRRSLTAVAAPANKPDAPYEAGPTTRIAPTASDCCPSQLSSTHMCFQYQAPASRTASTMHHKRKLVTNYVCLPARSVTDRRTCRVAADCGFNSSVEKAPSLSRPTCVLPAPAENATRLVRLVHGRQPSPAILFLGPIEDLQSFVGVSDYVPRLPGLLPAQLPFMVQTFCTYLFSLSGALVLLNVVPCYSLDGQWILRAILDIAIPCCTVAGRRFKDRVFACLLAFGTSLLALNVALALWHLYLQQRNVIWPVAKSIPVS